MNKRLDELFGKALDEAVPETWTVLNPEQLSRVKTKFAELIVRECVAQCWTVSEIEHKGNVLSECSKRMRKYFGVIE